MAKKKGLCHNYDGCDLAENHVVQEIDETNFICEECGKELFPEEGDSNGTTKTGPSKGVKLAILAGAVVVAAGAGFGIWKGISGSDEETSQEPPTEPQATHSVAIQAIEVGADWTLETTNLAVLKDGDTIWIAAKEGVKKEVAEAGVTPTLTLQDSTAVSMMVPETVKEVAAVKVTADAGKLSANYVVAVRKAATVEKESDNQPTTTGDQTPPKKGGLYNVSYASFDGTTLTFKKAHVIPGTSRIAQPGDKVSGVWKNGEVNSVRWYHANGDPSEVLTHE